MLGNDGASSISFKPVAVSGLIDAIAVSVGTYHSCAVTESGSAYCWGNNENGRLGDGTSYSQSTPVPVSGLSNAVAVTAGRWHSCARTASGQVFCWGNNTYGQLGDGSTSNRNTPVAVSKLSNAVQLTVGSSHSCSLNGIGQVVCWGYNLYGQLGNGSTANSSTPVQVSGLDLGYITPDAFSFTAQTRVALNALATSNLITVGGLKVVAPISVSNGSYSVNGGEYTSSAGSVSNGDTVSVRVMSSATPGTASAAVLTIGVVSGRFTVTTLAVQAAITGKLDGGESHNCAVLDSGQVVCWGDGAYGKLGNGSWSSSSTPIPVNGLTNALSVSAGWQHTCAVTGSGLVFCWGRGDDGQLGNGKTSNSYIPLPVSGISNVVAVSAGGSDSCYVDIIGVLHCVDFSHTCALTSDGAVLCWGDGAFGQLGNGTTSSSTPMVVSGLSNVVSISAGARHTCALTGDSTVFCWGSAVPSDLKNVIAITAGREHSCELTSSGTVICWGNNTFGQLGNGSGSSGTPVVGLNNAIAITAGEYHTCALTGSGSVVCWGYNAYGQLGNDKTIYKQTTPVPVLGLSNAVSVSAGWNDTCAQTGSGTVVCWGAVSLSNGGTPITVPGLNLGDITPDPFSFAALTGVALNSTFTSNMITLSGIKVATPISVSDGSYSVNGGAFTSVAGNVNNGATVSVRVNSAGTPLTDSTAALSVGAVSSSFTVTTHAASVPDPFNFASIKNAAKASVITSNSVLLSGFSGTLPISVSGGTYSVNGQPYTNAAGTVSSGSIVTLRQTSSSQSRGQTSVTLWVGPVSASFDVTTRSPSVSPILLLLLD
jgi:alpha-tubulin suppressor-like RCC1 family protein